MSDLASQINHNRLTHYRQAHYRLTTAHILYHMPDHPGLLQSFVWQQYDLAPQYPTLRRFLAFWAGNIDGKLHSVQVASSELLKAPQWRNAEALMTIH